MYKIVKRALDIIAAAIAVVLLAIPFLIIGVAIKCDSKGPVFFRQERLGRNGKIFRIIKFRSMVTDAQSMGAGLFNYDNDPRVTSVGRVLRQTSIDELPQIFNVLSGKMSFIGPRPAVVGELGDFATLNKRYGKRFSVKPGMSGLAQVNGRNDITWDRKVDFDNEYVDLMNNGFKGFGIDVVIFFKTIAKIFKRSSICESKDPSVSSEEAAEAEEREIIRLAHLPDEENEGNKEE